MSSLLAKMGMSDSTSKPELVYCDKCGKEKPMTQVVHPFKNEKRWVICACPCEIEELERYKEEEKQRRKRRRIEKALKLSSALEEIKNMTFDNYIPRPGTENVIKEIKDAVENFEKRGKIGVFVFGETGNGKSHIAAAGGNELIKRGYSVIFLTEKDLFSRLRSAKDFRNEESFSEIMNACVEADLLIWDDFMSSQQLTNEEKDWIFQIVNNRERANKPIWITSNITPAEFEDERTAYKLDDKGRTWWRLIGNMNVVYNKASNYRKVKAMSRALGISEDEYERRKLNE